MAVSKKKPAYKWPKTPGGLIDRAYRLRLQRQILSKQVEAIKSEEAAIKEFLIQTVKKSRLQGAKGREAQFSFKPIERPVIEDFDKICKWQVSKGGIIIVQRRLSEDTINQLWADKRKIPGVGVYDDFKFSLTKV